VRNRSDQFIALVSKHPENELFRFSLAQALLAENRPADAVEHLAFCANKKLDWMMPRILLGKALLELGRPAEGRPWLEQALALALAQDHEDPAIELKALLADR
jgi:predicted Zn-dependent protease